MRKSDLLVEVYNKTVMETSVDFYFGMIDDDSDEMIQMRGLCS